MMNVQYNYIKILEGGEEKKPKEIYIPPEPTNDENELFHGITTGINFAKYDDIEVNVRCAFLI